MPGLLVKVLKPPEKYRVGSFRDSIDYARGAEHDDDRDCIPERDLDGRMPARADGHRGHLIAMQGVSDLDHAALEMDAIADKSRAKDSVLHVVLSYGERVPAELVAEDCRRMLAVLGAGEHQYVCLGHDDVTGNYHAHLICNRTHATTHKAIHMSHSYARMECEATRINYARGWRIIPGQWNGKLIDHLVSQERDQITKASRSMEEKIDDLEKIRAENRSRHRPQTAAPKRLSVRTPRRALDIRQKRLRPMPGGELVYPEGSTQPVLSRDVSADARSGRRLRTLAAGHQREESRGSGVIPAELQSAARERGELPGALVLGPVIHAAFDGATSIRAAIGYLHARGISTRIVVDTVQKTGQRLPKISFGRDGLAVSGSQISLKASEIERRFSAQLEPLWSTDTKPPVDTGSRRPDPETSSISATNTSLRADFDRYTQEASEARRLERVRVRDQYRKDLDTERLRAIRRLERTRGLKLMSIAIAAEILGRPGYRGRRRPGFIRKTLTDLVWKAHWRRLNALEVDFRSRKKRVPESAYAGAEHPTPLSYVEWLQSLPPKPDVLAVIAAITASRYPVSKPTSVEIEIGIPAQVPDLDVPTQKIKPIDEGTRKASRKPPLKKYTDLVAVVARIADQPRTVLETFTVEAIRRGHDRTQVVDVVSVLSPIFVEGLDNEVRKRAARLIIDQGLSVKDALAAVEATKPEVPKKEKRKARSKPRVRGGIGDD